MECGDVSRIVQHGETGFVCPNGDEAQFAAYVRQLLGDRELRARMGRCGREVAEREFGVDRLVVNMLDAYRQAGWQG
jgi:glycosyltransferase involved in cell wall biosynthesis